MTTGMTMKSLAMELCVSVDRLICQFADIGIKKTNLDYVTEYEKNILFMNIDRDSQQAGVLNKLTLQRKIHSTLNVFSSGGKNKQVQVEVRKKHTYVQDHSEILTGNDEGSTVSSLHINDNSYNFDAIKNNALSVNIELLKNNFNKFETKNSETFLREKKDNQLISNNQVGENTVSSASIQYKNRIKDKSHVFEKTRKYNTPILSSLSDTFGTNKISEYDKKKISNDRRIRGRQRFRSTNKSRLNDHKIDVSSSVKYKRHYDHYIDITRSDDEVHAPVLRGIKKLQSKASVLTHAFNKPTHVVNRDVIIGEMITVSELANKMAVKSSHVIKLMMELGIMVTINQIIDQKTAQLIAKRMGHNVILRSENDLEDIIMNNRNCDSSSSNRNISNACDFRAPVVTIMGHVDHGKTSLLDCIRSSKVVDSEAGGITQHIGAYSVETSHNNKMITFLDTPGHAAFSAMRTRGVRITDIVVLVVAVDDGVMLQTIEAIQHVQSAKIPMIVVLNKIDKVDSSDNMSKIMHDLAQQGVISEEWGGETQFVRVSAKLGTGIDDLLTAILLESELLELKVMSDGMASGVVIESYLDKGKGPVAIVLVREGVLRCGNIILCGLEYGRVRSMRNEIGNSVNSAGPSVPVEVFGLSGPPFAGDLMVVVRNEREAREVALYRQGKFRSVKLAQKKNNNLGHTLTDVLNDDSSNFVKCNIILKADVQGSVEAIKDVLKNLSDEFNLKINIISSGVGWINETDVSLAVTTGSILFAFNVRSDILARRLIESEKLSVYYHAVIYDLINDVKKIIHSILIPKYKKCNIASAEVRNVFNLPKLGGGIAGCMILEGVVRRHNKVRVLRNNIVICEGELESLRRFKDDVNEVRAGMECGVVINNYKDIQTGDYIEIFENIDMNSSSLNQSSKI